MSIGYSLTLKFNVVWVCCISVNTNRHRQDGYIMCITWWGAIIFGYAMVVVVNVLNDIRFAPLINLVYKYVYT